MSDQFKNKVILITGGTGSIGSELVEQIFKFNPKQVRVFSRDENKQYYLLEKLNYPKNLRILIGDIRDFDRLNLALKGVDIVLHAAALKHVPLCEYNPFETVKTNIIGSQNIIFASINNNVKKVIAISTDKAVNPINTMGTSKLMMEKLFINANNLKNKDNCTTFACVRFGNVAWSNGSVLPLWKKQIESENILKITDRRMTRFFMSKEQAASLVLKATQISHMGEIFILKMPAIKLTDLSKIFIKKYYPDQKIKIKNTGRRSGEKLHEDLFDCKNQQSQILENKDMFIVLPDFITYAKIKNNSNKSSSNPTFNYPNFYKAKSANIKKFTYSQNCPNKKKISEVI